jgi:hypothetical protein
MKRLFVAALAVACIVGSNPGYARGGLVHGAGFAHGLGHGGFTRNPTILLRNPAPHVPVFQNRIPAPLPSPEEAPVINGPISQPAFRGLTGIGQ